jgi:hypothetical protein
MRERSDIRNFDFFVGDWSVQNKRLKTRFAGARDWETFPASAKAQSLLGGRVSVDEINIPHLQVQGLSIRVFDPERKIWSDRWLTRDSGSIEEALTGGFQRGVGTFYGDTSFNGKPIKVRYLWKDIERRSFTWEQAASLDGGRTWETNWIMKFRRVR